MPYDALVKKNGRIFFLCSQVCGKRTDVSATKGTIESPNFPNNYGNNVCSFTISAPDWKRIRPTFTTFIVETSTDIVSLSKKKKTLTFIKKLNGVPFI